jgi:hypothetical protein
MAVACQCRQFGATPHNSTIQEVVTLTPHFGIFNPPRRHHAGNPPGPDQPDQAAANPSIDRISRLERQVLALLFGETAEVELAFEDDVATPPRRPWRFIGMLMPPYS